MKDGEEALEDKGLGTEKIALDTAVFLGTTASRGCFPFSLLFFFVEVGEEGLVLAGGVVGGEVGG